MIHILGVRETHLRIWVWASERELCLLAILVGILIKFEVTIFKVFLRNLSEISRWHLTDISLALIWAGVTVSSSGPESTFAIR